MAVAYPQRRQVQGRCGFGPQGLIKAEMAGGWGLSVALSWEAQGVYGSVGRCVRPYGHTLVPR